jgi:curved DNA-binding protein CbpA
MGSHTWVRDNKKPGGGKTFAVGVAAVIPQAPPPKKRKLVWQRDANAAPANKTEPSTGEISTEAEAASQPQPQKVVTKTPTTTAAAAEKKRKELAALKLQIEQRKVALENSLSATQAAEQAEYHHKEAERTHRKRKLEIGFSSAFAAAKQAAAADIASSKASLSFADQKEVDRVLAAGSDYGVLKLAPGADSASIKKRYKEMAIQLHPDKCKAPEAGDAFHKLVKAYQHLSKYTT